MRAGSAVEVTGLDKIGHGGGDQVADGLAEFDAVSDFGCGDGVGVAAEAADAKAGGRWGGDGTGAGDDDELEQLGELIGVAPLGESGQVILADEPVEGGFGEAGSVVPRGVDGEGDATAFDFLGVDFDAGVTGEAEPEHLQAEGSGGGWAAGFEGGLGGGDEEDPVQVEFLEGRPGHEEMTRVNGVEGTSEDGETEHGGDRGVRGGRCRWGGGGL